MILVLTCTQTINEELKVTKIKTEKGYSKLDDGLKKLTIRNN
jgi:hypothetical protein